MLKKTKRIWVVIVTGSMLCLSLLAGCGTSEEKRESENVMAVSQAKLKEGAIDGQTQMPSYNEKEDAAEDLITGAAVVYTVPEGYDGTYDLYLQMGRSVYVQGTTYFELHINDKVYVLPTEPESVNEENDAYDMGRFLAAAGVVLKTGDEVELVTKGGFSSYSGGKIYTLVPPVGNMEIYEAGTEVTQGYGTMTSEQKEETDSSDPISGKTIYWLGSSVTYGAQAQGYSMVEYISDHHADVTCMNYSISGTTLANQADTSYVARMFSDIPKDAEMDMLIVQLSTNDATAISEGKNLKLGQIADGKELKDFDDTTVIGAMETIIAYAGETWNCPVTFYTGTWYDSQVYGQMVDALYQLQDKWGIGIIDLWNDSEMTAVAGTEEYDSYMADPIHPNRTGYETWWGPKIDEKLISIFSAK